MRFRRVATTVVFVVPLLAVLLLAVLLVRAYYRRAEQDVRPILEQELTRTLGHEVKVGRVELRQGHAYIDDVQVAEGKSFAEGGAIARARQVVVDVDLRRILLSKDRTLPLFAQARVIDPVAYIRRDSRGKWNFEDLFKPPTKPPARPGVGTVTVSGGTVFYEDSFLPHHEKRSQTLFTARFDGVAGTLFFYASRGATWTLRVGGSQHTGVTDVTGSYDPLQPNLLIRVQAAGVKLPLLTRLMPPDTRITGGVASGKLTVTRTVDSAGRALFDYQSSFQFTDGSLVTGRLAEAVTGIRGAATVARELATVRADGTFAGSGIHAEGTVLGLQDPVMHGWAQGSGLQLGRALTALRLEKRLPALRRIAATANVRADVRGPLSKPVITARGPVTVSGPLPGGARLMESGTLQLAFSGTLNQPAILLSGSLPLVRYQGYSAKDIRLSAVFDSRPGGQSAADLNGKIGGGTVSARVALRAEGKEFSYRANARLRGLDLRTLPLPLIKGKRPAGRINADLVADGRTGKGRNPRGHARIEATGIAAAGYSMAKVDARLRSDGVRLTVGPAVLSDPKGVAVVTGSFGLNDRTLDLKAEADGLDLATWQSAIGSANLAARVSRSANPGAGRDARANPTGPPDLSGLAYLRNVTIQGPLSGPRVAGRVYAYDIRSERVEAASSDSTPLVDYLVSDFHADRQALTLLEGRAYRFPSVATVTGIIARPFSPSPRLDLEGSYDQIDVNDLAGLSGADLDAAGLAQGTFQVVGFAERPEIVLPDIQVQGARVADFDFDRFNAAVRYAPFQDGGLWTLDSLTAVRARPNISPEEWTMITASGTLTGDRRFALDASVQRADLALVEPYLSDFVTVSGTAEATVRVTGLLRDGKAVDLSGDASVGTRGLTVNKVSIGDLRGLAAGTPARISFTEDRFTSNDLRIGDETMGVALAGGATAAPALVYDRDTDALRVKGELLSIRIDLLRQALANSPYIAQNPDSVATRWLKPIANPLEGTIGGTFAVTGSAAEPVTKFDWATTGARIEGNAIDAFTGSVTFTRDRVDLETASLTTGETIFTASGSLVYGKTLVGGIETNNLPLRLAKQWFPGRPVLRDLEGVAESVHLSVLGDPANPSLTASVLFKDVVWIETVDPEKPEETQPANPPAVTPAAPGSVAPLELSPGSRIRVVERVDRAGKTYQTTTTGRELWISSLDTSTITVNSPQNPNQIRADNIHVTLREPDPLPSSPQGARPRLATPREFKIYAHGQSAFDWLNVDVLKNPDVRFEVNVPQQPVNALLALIPKPENSQEKPDDIVGSLRAQLLWTGTIQKPNITGSIEATADKIHFANRATQIRDLNAALDFTGDAIQVRQLTAFTEIVDPRSKKVLRTSDPIRVTGSIGLTEQTAGGPVLSIWPPRISSSDALHITAEHLKLAETALPGWVAGRVILDDAAVNLKITGSVLKPHIAGKVDIRTADVRLPESFAEQPAGRKPGFEPSFDVEIALGEKVRVVASPLSAAVRTSVNDPIMLRGDLAGGDVTRLSLTGTLVVASGTLAFPTARFALQPGGRVTLRYPYRTFTIAQGEPILLMNVDVRAVTRMTAPPANNPNQLKRYTITVEARGPLNSGAPVRYQDQTGFGAFLDQGLKLTFRSDPPDLASSEAELRRKVTARLGGESAIQGLFAGGSSVGRIVRQQVTDILSESFIPGLLEPLVGRGFEEFTLDVSQLNAFTLRISRHLFGPVYLGYWRRLSGSSQTIPGEEAAWQFKLSYRFRPQLQFSFTTDDQRTNAYLLEGVFRF